MRGNHPKQRVDVARIGSIPASAGKPPGGNRPPDETRVYPRECGETRSVSFSVSHCEGLSPRVRGNRHRLRKELRDTGSIPASAGKPLRPPGKVSLMGVYPRECGETNSFSLRAGPCLGLSPRVRGNPVFVLQVSHGMGSIPASAGKPRRWCAGPPLEGVYPRECGETLDLNFRQAGDLGLSPRVRGNHHSDEANKGSKGSIPASAGKPSMTKPTAR